MERGSKLIAMTWQATFGCPYVMGYDYAAEAEAEEERMFPHPLLTARIPAVLTADLLHAAEGLAAGAYTPPLFSST